MAAPSEWQHNTPANYQYQVSTFSSSFNRPDYENAGLLSSHTEIRNIDALDQFSLESQGRHSVQINNGTVQILAPSPSLRVKKTSSDQKLME
ncbi:hypothetical protein DSL72_004045 [Monilinia vaccinii-corymbosi]|uniref:Uncharacterized protein n=1 Tax=Monilinia vaccinii-corymbosi TaxID=61207 RepID=A0A8A3P3S3_9HELO|nr:hypothetical protein DSL72_004045 [Monilinia vaccinii-corymbosi]